jgi:drug/metabolite transporter (DMT)-like permease
LTPNRLAGWLAAAVSTVAFSIAAPIATGLIAAGLNPTLMLLVRLWLALGLLVASLAVFAPARLRLDRRGALIAGFAGLATGVSVLLFFWALTRLDTAIASMLFGLQPLTVLALLALRGERFTYRQYFRLALGLLGVYFLVGADGRSDWLGVVMVLVAVVTSSFQTVFIQWYLHAQDGRTVTAYMVGGMAVTTTVFWLAGGGAWSPLPPGAWLGIVVMAVVPTYLARLTLFSAVRHLGSGQIALLTPLETLLTVIWSVLFLGERLSPYQLLGGALIVTSAVLAVRRLERARVAAADQGS